MARTWGGVAAVLAMAVCLAAPGGAGAQSRTFGSALDKVPNTFGCETEPTFTSQSYNGDYFFLASGDPDCTWMQAGVEGNTSDPRTGAVPGDGRITSVSVRSGNNPAPLRFVIATQLDAGRVGGCCYFRSETPLLQPEQNKVTTFPVNLPVQKNADAGVIRGDYIGVSAPSGAGTLPLFGDGRHNTLTYSGPGTLQAAFWYPRLTRENSQASSRNPGGIPNMEVLLRWTWCPGAGGARAAQSCSATGGGSLGRGDAAAAASVVGSRLRARRGRVGLKVRCLLAGGCRGRARLRTRGTGASARKSRIVGSKKLRIAGGKTATVRIRLNRLGRRLARRRKTALVAVVDLGKAGTTKKNVTLRR